MKKFHFLFLGALLAGMAGSACLRGRIDRCLLLDSEIITVGRINRASNDNGRRVLTSLDLGVSGRAARGLS